MGGWTRGGGGGGGVNDYIVIQSKYFPPTLLCLQFSHMKFCQQWSCLAFRILALTTGSCAFSQPEREKVKHDSPCPIRMFANNGRATKCGEIYCYVCMFANNGRATTFLVGVY